MEKLELPFSMYVLIFLQIVLTGIIGLKMTTIINLLTTIGCLI